MKFKMSRKLLLYDRGAFLLKRRNKNIPNKILLWNQKYIWKIRTKLLNFEKKFQDQDESTDLQKTSNIYKNPLFIYGLYEKTIHNLAANNIIVWPLESCDLSETKFLTLDLLKFLNELVNLPVLELSIVKINLPN